MPMLVPWSPTNLVQPKVEACSTETRALTWAAERGRGKPDPDRRSSSQQGMLTTRALMPSCASFSWAPDAQRDLAAGAHEDHVGLAVGGVGQDVSPCARPAAEAYLARSRVGRFWRDRMSTDGLVAKLRDELPGLDNFVGVARTDHQEPGNRAQRRNLLDGLMGRPVLAHADRVMRENVDDRQLHDGRPVGSASGHSR